MILFDNFEAVRFPEENLIFITWDGFLYYIYNKNNNSWRKYRNAGNDQITVNNYPDVSIDEIKAAMNGTIPRKKTDFLRLISISDLSEYEMQNLLDEDYSIFMTNWEIEDSVETLFRESIIKWITYEKIKQLFDNACESDESNEKVIEQIRALGKALIGKDIFKEEIRIVDGHNSSSYFWIMPVSVVDYDRTWNLQIVSEMRVAEISIEEFDVRSYLLPFLKKYFDTELDANKNREIECKIDENGIEHIEYLTTDFEWYLTYNFYTFESITKILNDIRNTVSALSAGVENEYTPWIQKHMMGDDTIEMLMDFYRRFIFRMEYMIKVGTENGYNLISFMGP